MDTSPSCKTGGYINLCTMDLEFDGNMIPFFCTFWDQIGYGYFRIQPSEKVNIWYILFQGKAFFLIILDGLNINFHIRIFFFSFPFTSEASNRTTANMQGNSGIKPMQIVIMIPVRNLNREEILQGGLRGRALQGLLVNRKDSRACCKSYLRLPRVKPKMVMMPRRMGMDLYHKA